MGNLRGARVWGILWYVSASLLLALGRRRFSEIDMKSGMACGALVAAVGLASGLGSEALAQPALSTSHQWVIENGNRILRGVGGSDAVGPDVIVGEIHSSQSQSGSMGVTISPSTGTPLNGIAAYGLGQPRAISAQST
jgi:hypothetical protein